MPDSVNEPPPPLPPPNGVADGEGVVSLATVVPVFVASLATVVAVLVLLLAAFATFVVSNEGSLLFNDILAYLIQK
jgi:hypothetical protein